MLIGEDAGSKLLRSRIIEEIYGLKVQRTQVLNPELLPEVFFGKRTVLDVVLEDETGHLYDLEMQVSGYTKEEQLRFQQYGYRLVGRQLKQGDDYTKLKPFYQIIFMNSMPKAGGRMIRHYTVKAVSYTHLDVYKRQDIAGLCLSLHQKQKMMQLGICMQKDIPPLPCF